MFGQLVAQTRDKIIYCRDDQHELVAECRLKRQRGTLEDSDHAGWHADFLFGLSDRIDRLTERCALCQIE